MGIKTQDETMIRKHLLGQLSNDELEEIELWMMSDDDAMDLVNAAEDDLIDESLAGRLRGNDLRQFESHFLVAPERRKKYQFSKTLYGRLHPDVKSMTSNGEKPTRESLWAVIRSWFQYPLRLGYAASVFTVILTAGILYQVQLSSRIASVQSLNDVTQSKLIATQHALQEAKNISANQGLLYTLKLASGPLTRSATSANTLEVRSPSELIYLQAELPDGEARTYSAELYQVGQEQPVRTWNPVKVVVEDGKRMAVIIEAGVNLPSAEYNLKIKGNSPSPASDVRTSHFMVVRHQ